MPAITISRQLGSGGATIARAVAEQLGFHLLDRELVDLVVERLPESSEAASLLDERAYGWASSVVFSVLQMARGRAVTPETYSFVAAEVIREAAARESVVILGRGAQVILGKRPGTYHIHVVASAEVRAARIAERDGVNLPEAQRQIRQSDREREEHIRAVGQRDWEDPLLYDLVLNTDRLSPTAAAGIVVAAAQASGQVRARR